MSAAVFKFLGTLKNNMWDSFYTITRPARKFIWLKSYVLLVLPSDPNIPNGILSTGANLKCLKRLREVQSGSISDDNAELVAKLDPAACAV